MLLALSPAGSLSEFVLYVALYGLALLSAHLLAKLCEAAFHNHLEPRLKPFWIRLRLWLSLPSAPDRFPFEVLRGNSALERWLTSTQRLTLISNINSRLATIVGSENYPKHWHVLVHAQADIGKTREALWLTETWIKQHKIEDTAVILVPRNPFCIPPPPNIPPSSFRRLLGDNVILFLDDLPVLCRDPGASQGPQEAIRRLIDYFEAFELSSFLVLVTGRMQELRRALGENYLASAPFDAFKIAELPDLSPIGNRSGSGELGPR